jgi:carbon monoxide dehydrogenase subunit G
MQLTHQFTVPASIDRVWPVLLDLERIAPCMPGAAITSFDGQRFTGLVKVKIGPVNLSFDGKGSITEKDEAAHRFGVVASGRDARGAGTAEARITVTLSTPEPGSTRADVVTDMAISGKAAQMGRGMIADVSGKLLAQFVNCLSQQFAGEGQPAVVESAQPAGQPAQPVTAEAVPAAAAGTMPVDAAPVTAPVGTSGFEPASSGQPSWTAEPESVLSAEPIGYADRVPAAPEIPESELAEPDATTPAYTAPEPVPAQDIDAGAPPAVAAPVESPVAPSPDALVAEPAPVAAMPATPIAAEPVAAQPAAARAEPEPVDLLAVTGAGKWLKRIGVVVVVIAVIVVVWLIAR